jgi:hypothetical protein
MATNCYPSKESNLKKPFKPCPEGTVFELDAGFSRDDYRGSDAGMHNLRINLLKIYLLLKLY